MNLSPADRACIKANGARARHKPYADLQKLAVRLRARELKADLRRRKKAAKPVPLLEGVEK